MRWSIITAGPVPGDLADISAAARSASDPVPATTDAVGDLLAEPATEGLGAR